MLALIDADIVAYRAAFAAEKVMYDVYLVGEEEYGTVFTASSKTELVEFTKEDDKYFVERRKEIKPVGTAIMAAKAIMENILASVGTSDYEAYLTGPGNFRDKLATIKPYKGNRKPEDKPVYLPDVRQYLQQMWGAQMITGMEADDAMGIFQAEAPYDTIICSIDKDLKQVPGWNYNFVTGEKMWITPVEGLRSFYKQMLTGDATDNIPGLYHITGTRCTKDLIAEIDSLNTEKDMFQYVHSVYTMDMPSNRIDEVVLEIGRLLWVLRKPNEMWEFPH